jgi:hypothetical protein
VNVSTTIPATVQIRRSRLLGLIGAVAAVAAAITWAVLAFAVDTGAETAQQQSVSAPTVVSSPIPSTGYLEAIRTPTTMLSSPIPSTGYLDAINVTAPTVVSSPTPSTGNLEAISSLTPAQLRAAFGTDLTPATRAPRRAEVLASLSPQSRRYVEAVMAMTPATVALGDLERTENAEVHLAEGFSRQRGRLETFRRGYPSGTFCHACCSRVELHCRYTFGTRGMNREFIIGGRWWLEGRSTCRTTSRPLCASWPLKASRSPVPSHA